MSDMVVIVIKANDEKLIKLYDTYKKMLVNAVTTKDFNERVRLLKVSTEIKNTIEIRINELLLVQNNLIGSFDQENLEPINDLDIKSKLSNSLFKFEALVRYLEKEELKSVEITNRIKEMILNKGSYSDSVLFWNTEFGGVNGLL